MLTGLKARPVSSGGPSFRNGEKSLLSGVQGPPLGDYFLNQSVEVGARWSCGGTICGQRGGASLWDGRLQSPREDQQQGGDRPRVTWRNGWLLSWDDTGGLNWWAGTGTHHVPQTQSWTLASRKGP